MDVNVRGPFLAGKHVVLLMPVHAASAIVNVASWCSYEGQTLFAAYCASKAAIRLLTQMLLAADVAPRLIWANVGAPGNIDGSMHMQVLARVRSFGDIRARRPATSPDACRTSTAALSSADPGGLPFTHVLPDHKNFPPTHGSTRRITSKKRVLL